MRSRTIVLNPLQKLFGEEFNANLFFRIIKKNLVWSILIVLSTIALSFIYLHFTTPIYEASTYIMIKPEQQTEILDVQKSFNNNESEIHREMEVVKSKKVLERAIAKLPLKISYYEVGEVLTSELYQSAPFSIKYKLTDNIIYNTPIYFKVLDATSYEITFQINFKTYKYNIDYNSWHKTPFFQINTNLLNANSISELTEKNFYFTFNSNKNLIDNLSKKILVNIGDPQANTMQVSMKNPNSKKIIDIVNTVAEEYISYDLEKRTESATLILNFINDQLKVSGTDLAKSENNLKNFKKEEHILNPSNEEIKINSEYKGYENEAFNLTIELNSLQWLYEYVLKNEDLSAVSNATIYGMYASLSEQIKILIKLKQDKQELLLSVTEESPSIDLIKEQIIITKKNLLQSIQNAIHSVEEKQKFITKKTTKYEKDFLHLPEKESEFIRLSRLSEINEKFYMMLLEKKSEYAIVKEGIISNKAILRKAEMPSRPISPNRIFINSLGVMSGLFMSILLFIISYFLHNKVLHLSDLEKNIDANILGAVPQYVGEMNISKMVIFDNPKSAISESFRSLRSNLQYISNEKGSKTIAVTSTISGEGKTFVALNLAGIHALVDKKVVIIDLDLRNPKIHKSFEIDNTCGMSSLYIKKSKLEDCIQKTPWENIDVIPSGPIPPNPSELINSEEHNNIINMLKKKYDLIVIDTPPVGIVVDALELLNKVDYPIYVLKSNYSNTDFMNNINKLFNENKISKLSVVLNSISENSSSYGYGYGYGYGYYSDQEIKKSFWQKLFNKS